MSRIADLTGHSKEKAEYTKIAHEYLDFWSIHGVNKAANPPHTVLQYDNGTTYGKILTIMLACAYPLTNENVIQVSCTTSTLIRP